MPIYTFQLAAHLAGRAVSVTAAGGTDVVASGTLDSNAKFVATLPVGDYVATAGTGYYRHSSAGTVDLGDRDGLLTTDVANSTYARTADVTDVTTDTGAALLDPSLETQLREDYRRVYGVIGTGGKGVIALRFDHHLNALKNTLIPLLSARSLPFGVCVYSGYRPDGAWPEPNSSDVTFADIESWGVNYGAEVWSHGWSHRDATTRAGIYHEIVTSKAELEAAMPQTKIKGLMQAGVGNAVCYNDFDTTNQWPSRDTYAGKLIRRTFALYEADMTMARRATPTGPVFGAGHITTDGMTLANLQAEIDKAANYKGSLEIMTHATLVGQAGQISLADWTAMLDYIVAKRDAGLIEVITPAGIYAADVGSTSRIDLIGRGDFKNMTIGGDTGPWSGLVAPWTLGTDAATGLNYATTSTGSIITQSQLLDPLALRGETYRFEFKARRTDGATSGVPRVIVSDASNLTLLNKTFVLAAPATGTGWTQYRIPFTWPKGVVSPRLQVGRNTGASLDIADIHCMKI